MGDSYIGPPNVIALNAARGCSEAWLPRSLPCARVGCKMWGAEVDACLRGRGGWPGETRTQPFPMFAQGGQKKVTQWSLEVGEHPEGTGLALGHKVGRNHQGRWIQAEVATKNLTATSVFPAYRHFDRARLQSPLWGFKWPPLWGDKDSAHVRLLLMLINLPPGTRTCEP